MAKIAVIGTGYVGLSSGACFAHLGHNVTCVDVVQKKIDDLNNGILPIAEKDLDSIVVEGIRAGLLSFTVDISKAVANSEAVFLCLPTPEGEDGAADISYIEAAVQTLAPLLESGAVLVNKSTVPVGTASKMKIVLNRDDVEIVSNPEFLRQGTAVQDFLHPTRIVIGGEKEEAVQRVASLYDGVDSPVLLMGTASAEALKYAANAFLATKLTFINAMADICDLVGADIFDVATGIGMDPRIGKDMLSAGPGWGGSCFPKDTRALVSIASQAGYDFELLRGVIETNDRHYERIANKVIEECGGSVVGLTIAAWGLTFKANTDDLRDSPAIKILAMLERRGARINAHDPSATGPYSNYPWINIFESPVETCVGADVLVVLTEWSDYAEVHPSQISEKLQIKSVIDGRNILNRELWQQHGFRYRGVGR